MSHLIDKRHYADIYGPTTGDRVRLGDTDLIAQVESDATVYGDECKFGGGKVLRDGMGQATGVSESEALDCVITNALVIDWTAIRYIGLSKAEAQVMLAAMAFNLRRWVTLSRTQTA